MSQDKEVRPIVDEITYAAFSRPWPGRNGPRNSKVLAGLLRDARQRRPLTLAIGLHELGVDVGISDYTSIHDALADLEVEGWISFELGTADDWRPGGELGKPSRIALHPRWA